MKYLLYIFVTVLTFSFNKATSQTEFTHHVFSDQPVNFEGMAGTDDKVVRLQKGRLIYKKIEVPAFEDGSDVILKLSLRSAGDRWDKTGSCFVLSDPNQISILDVSEGKKKFPINTGINEGNLGIQSSKNYSPVIELMRFITPFGVGHFSENDKGHRRPVYIPNWEKEIVWEQDISHLLEIVDNSFVIGVWIDSWTKEGYLIDLSLTYSNRPNKIVKTKSLINTVSYVDGQSLPEFFAEGPLEHKFHFDTPVKNVKLHYITTGHGGHSGGDEFSKRANRIRLDNKLLLDFTPWRSDCASFRRFNPSSGVWLKKDSAEYIDFQAHKYKVKEIEERIASSDLSRSNWCPGSKVAPVIVELGDMKEGDHRLSIDIDAARAEKNKYNHWLVSAYLTYE